MQPTVLIAILNWGLGHSTRSIPIIDSFLLKKYVVHIASDGEALTFLKKEYPKLIFHNLPGYNISYNYNSIVLNVIISSFSIFNAIYKEKAAINSIVQKIKPDLIISDNRYGARSSTIKSVLITHQLNIKLNNVLLAKWGTGFIRYLIRKFDEIWIPDFSGISRLSGELSAVNASEKFKFIGPLSRFNPAKSAKKYDIAVVLSGPEPQRSIFEKIILAQLNSFDKKVIVIRGKVKEQCSYALNDNVEVKNYLLSQELNEVICQSDIIISRSGYSTIMDLAVLGKKAILVPTPGQTEQEYLAKYLKKKRFYYSCCQNDFDLKKSLEKSKEYTGVKLNINSIIPI